VYIFEGFFVKFLVLVFYDRKKRHNISKPTVISFDPSRHK